MAKKNRCYLCGGKLTDGYCPDCGLDNTRIRRKHYHLNESDSVESMNGDPRKASQKCKEKSAQMENRDAQLLRPVQHSQAASVPPAQGSGNAGTPPVPSAQAGQGSFRKTAQAPQGGAKKPPLPRQTLRSGQRYPSPSLPASGKVKIAASVIGLVVVVSGFLAEYAQRSPAGIGDVSFDEPAVEWEDQDVYSDPYGYVERELSETGEHYEIEIGTGEYLVGVHLPEGAYTAELKEGVGIFSVDDYENGIYLWQAFGADEEYDEVEILEDIRLYTGARVRVDNGVVLHMAAENAQTGQMEAVENPLSDAVSLKAGETMTAGEDFSAGVYDVGISDRSDASVWAVLNCRIPDEDYEEGYYERSYWLSGEELEQDYRNLYLSEGIEITAEENGLLLTPSETVGSGDYGEYYQHL